MYNMLITLFLNVETIELNYNLNYSFLQPFPVIIVSLSRNGH